MHIQYLDLYAVLFFAVVMLVVSRLRSYISSRDEASYKKIISGVSILTGLSLVQVYANLGLFQSVPFLSDELFFRLISWIGGITGVVILTNGLSSWLPLSKLTLEQETNKAKQLGLIRKVAQLVRVENRIDRILSETLSCISEIYTPDLCAAFTLSRTRGLTNLVAQDVGENCIDHDLSNISFDIPSLDIAPAVSNDISGTIINGLPNGLRSPETIVPVKVKGRTTAVILVWKVATEVTNENELQFMRLAVEIIERKILLNRLDIETAFSRQQEEFRNEAEEIVGSEGELKDKFAIMARLLMGNIPVDTVTLTTTDSDLGGQRLSMSESGTMLHEKRVSLNKWRHELNQHFQNNAPTTRQLDDGNVPDWLSELSHTENARWVTTMPIIDSGRVNAVLTVTGLSAVRTPRQIESTLRTVSPTLTAILAGERHTVRMTTERRRSTLVSDLFTQFARHGDLDRQLDRAAAMITHELDVDLARISIFDEDGSFLNSRASVSSGASKFLTPVDAHMVVSLMPAHRRVKTTGRSVVIDQNNPEQQMEAAEARQAFNDEIQTTLLVPLVIGRNVVGVLGLADTRDSSQFEFSEDAVRFAAGVANSLSIAIQFSQGQGQSRSAVERIFADSELRRQLISPLSGIIGSTEKLRNADNMDSNADRYLEIIDKSAQRINECLAGVEATL